MPIKGGDLALFTMPDVTKTERFAECLKFRDANKKALTAAGVDLSQPDSLGRLAVAFSDGVIEAEAGVSETLLGLVKEKGTPCARTGFYPR